MRLALLVLVAFLCVGCKHEGAITPQQEVISKPASPRFKLDGVWIPDTDALLPAGSGEPVVIRKVGNGVFAVDFADFDGIDIEVRTTAIGQRKRFAIAEAHASANGDSWLRFVGIIRFSDDKLGVSWIESKNLAKLMHKDGHSAVIEHSAFGTKVFADSDDLLDCITKHTNELTGKPVTFTRKTK